MTWLKILKENYNPLDATPTIEYTTIPLRRVISLSYLEDTILEDELIYCNLENIYTRNKIRLELEIIRRVISKTQNILESSGNKYLQEGYLEKNSTSESKEFINQSDSKNAFYWFLENSYIQLAKKSEKIHFPIIEIKILIETLLSYIPENEDIENWTEFDVDFTQALGIIKAYENFLLAFKDKFAYDKKVLMSFSPSKNLSSGEKGLYDLFSVLNDLNYRIENNIHTDYSIFNKREKVTDNLLILLDEADLGFHPEWKKKYVNIIQQIIPFIFTAGEYGPIARGKLSLAINFIYYPYLFIIYRILQKINC